MPKGIAVPLQVNLRGGVATSEFDADADKTIRLALSDNDNDNAFQQDIGLGQRFIYDPNSPGFRGFVLQAILSIFADFEKANLFRLVKGSIRWTKDSEGEQKLEFKYVNLESDEVESYVQVFAARGR